MDISEFVKSKVKFLNKNNIQLEFNINIIRLIIYLKNKFTLFNPYIIPLPKLILPRNTYIIKFYTNNIYPLTLSPKFSYPSNKFKPKLYTIYENNNDNNIVIFPKQTQHKTLIKKHITKIIKRKIS